MKYIIEIFGLNKQGQPTVLHSFTHTASSVHMVQETMKAVRASAEWPSEASGYRIRSASGGEIYSAEAPLYKKPHKDRGKLSG